MTHSTPKRVLILAGLAALNGSTALAQSAQPGSGVILLEEITVTGSTEAELLREQISKTDGASGVVGREDYEQIPTPTIADALADQPGVVVQEFFGSNDQPRIQIRGSGLQQSPTERGLLVLQNGMPVNRADGSYIVGLTSPGNAEAIEVWRGAAANRLGATVLGGAINFISPTASTDPGTRIGVTFGSYGQLGLYGQSALGGEDANVLFQFEHSQKDGYRDINNDSERTAFNANSQIRHGSGASQLYFSYTDLSFGVPGPITKSALNENSAQNHSGPSMVPPGRMINPGPNVYRDLPRREATQLLAGARTSLDLGDHLMDFGLSLSDTDDSFRFPIAGGERVADGWDGTISARYAFKPDYVNGLPLIEANLTNFYGQADRAYYHNTSGERGPKFGSNDLSASTFTAHIGANIPLSPSLVLSPSLSYTRANRSNTDTWSAATRPTVGYNPRNQTMRCPTAWFRPRPTAMIATIQAGAHVWR